MGRDGRWHLRGADDGDAVHEAGQGDAHAAAELEVHHADLHGKAL